MTHWPGHSTWRLAPCEWCPCPRVADLRTTAAAHEAQPVLDILRHPTKNQPRCCSSPHVSMPQCVLHRHPPQRGPWCGRPQRSPAQGKCGSRSRIYRHSRLPPCLPLPAAGTGWESLCADTRSVRACLVPSQCLRLSTQDRVDAAAFVPPPSFPPAALLYAEVQGLNDR